MGEDTVYRQAAIDAMCEACSDWCDEGVCKKVSAIQKLPSAQLEQSPEIQDILNYLDTVLHPIISPEHWGVYSDLHDMISALPSAEPDDAALHESCTDCPLYDHDRHRCPRFNKVIPTTIQEIQDTQTQRWIPVTERLPEEDGTYIVCLEDGSVFLYGYISNWYDDDAWEYCKKDVVAWMPRPEPYREEENGMSDLIDRQEAIDALADMHCKSDEDGYVWIIRSDAWARIDALPSAQPERTCVNCGRTANNGGWYADGRTRCPIEEHYALPKDGYCHLWEKRNVTDDDYPERRADE